MPYVLMPYLTAEGAGGPPQPGFLGGWLGKTHDPFLVLQGGKGPDGFDLPALTPGVGNDRRARPGPQATCWPA